MMPAPIGQVGPPMHPNIQQPPQTSQPTAATQAQQIEAKYDNINKVKHLLWSLKDSFANVMKVASARVNHMASGKTSEDAPARFDKTLEEFFSICNQIELHLKTIQECTLQQKDSITFLPLHVSLGKQDATAGPSQDGNLTYSQFVSVIKGQVNFVKSLQDMLNEGSRKITQAE